MSEQNGADSEVTAEAFAAHDDAASLNGYGAAPESTIADRPEVLIGAAVIGGLLLAGMVRRFGR